MKKVMMDTDMVSTPGPMTKNPYANSDPIRALEPHIDSGSAIDSHPMQGNHMNASRVPGAGIKFGRVGMAPDKSNLVPRDSVAARNPINPRM